MNYFWLIQQTLSYTHCRVRYSKYFGELFQGPGPHAFHKQSASHQTVHILFLANDFAVSRKVSDF